MSRSGKWSWRWAQKKRRPGRPQKSATAEGARERIIDAANHAPGVDIAKRNSGDT
jgi:hypothetical protein